MTRMQAAALHEVNTALKIETVDLEAPRQNEIQESASTSTASFPSAMDWMKSINALPRSNEAKSSAGLLSLNSRPR